MKAIVKSKIIPLGLNNQKAREEFAQNIDKQSYVGKDIYATVKEDLLKLYQNKCAYCECDISEGAYFHIDHYRCKSIYYWLAYSWDNLLLSCPACNQKKKDRFPIKSKNRVTYNKEELIVLHDKINEYDRIEQPLLLNPEQLSQVQLKQHFTFNIKGEIVAKTVEMRYTICCCGLNREQLINKRFSIFANFKFAYDLSSNKYETIEIFEKLLDKQIKEIEEYTAWREFLKDLLNRLKKQNNAGNMQ